MLIAPVNTGFQIKNKKNKFLFVNIKKACIFAFAFKQKYCKHSSFNNEIILLFSSVG